jgi:hypothetical protein
VRRFWFSAEPWPGAGRLFLEWLFLEQLFLEQRLPERIRAPRRQKRGSHCLRGFPGRCLMQPG